MNSSPRAQLEAFWGEAWGCRECAKLAPWRKFPAEVRGNPAGGVVILGEAPGRVSLENQRPFSNPRNLMIRQAFAKAIAPAILEPEEVVYFTDAVKCWPASSSGANRSPSLEETRRCIALHLRRELAIIRPQVIFAFGVRAVSALLEPPVRLAAIHGRLSERDGVRIIPLMHPSTINIAGMRRVGIRDLAEYERQLTGIFKDEFARMDLSRFPPSSAAACALRSRRA